MEFNINNKFDVFDILGISNREDSYTDLLKYLFNNSKIFRNNFLKLVFNELPKNPESIKFITRSAYTVKKSKNIPDVILYNKNDFAIVEVKVDAKEGNQQTQRYYDIRNNIMKKLKVTGNGLRKYKFLTFFGEKPNCIEFESITWIQVGECIPEITNIKSDIDFYLYSLKERCKSLDVIINKDDLWIEAVNPNKWSSSLRMLKALSSLFDSSYDKVFHWYGFSKSSATSLYRVYVGKHNWISKNSISKINNDPTTDLCFDIHFEFSWDEETRLLKTQVHYELNPYHSVKDLEKLLPTISKKEQDFIIKNNKRKADIVRLGKIWWEQNGYNKLYKDFNYAKKIKENLFSVVTYKQIISDKDTVSDVLNRIQPFITIGNTLIEYLIQNLNNN